MSESSVQHNPLLRWQEDELKRAEAKVLGAFRVGWKADDWSGVIVVPPEGSSTPEKPAEGHTADNWQDSILRAEFLRDLFLDNSGKFAPRPIVISRAWIEGRLNLDYRESRLPLAFSQCIFSDGISLRNASIPELQLSGCEIRRSLFAPGAKVSASVRLDDEFKAEGEVRLRGAEIDGPFTCSGYFKKGLYARNLKAGENVRLAEGFKSCGVVDLSGAEISETLYLGYATIGVTNWIIDDDGPSWRNLTRVPVVNLRGAEIRGALDLSHMTTNTWNSVTVIDDPVLGPETFLEFESDGVVDLSGTEISGYLDLGGAKIEVILDNAKVHGALERLQKWPRRGSVNGFRCLKIEITDDKKEGLDWLCHMPRQLEFSPQPYEYLMSVYRRMGHTNWARKVGFALEKRRSKEFKGWQWLTWRPWYGILGLTIGYGYKPFRFVPWALGLVMAGFLLFGNGHYWQAPAFLDNEWIPSEVEVLESESWTQNRKPPKDYLPFNPLVYSLESIFPVLSLGQLEKWHPSNGFLLGVRWALTLIGSPLLAILALFGAGVLGPRWRSGDEGG